ncbi:hypothetical protein ACIHFD_35005 [Nonomuraea sp. NPDC051941]|uniref:hypothetical protein n=1 Tax=Nonomuraea sp. NPDC051941 TaxID=3364373 RepID=UPI0037CBC5D6
MSSLAPEQHDSAGPRRGPAGRPAAGHKVSGRLPWTPGRQIWASVKAAETHAHPA